MVDVNDELAKAENAAQRLRRRHVVVRNERRKAATAVLAQWALLVITLGIAAPVFDYFYGSRDVVASLGAAMGPILFAFLLIAGGLYLLMYHLLGGCEDDGS